jgi:hypothetical protein
VGKRVSGYNGCMEFFLNDESEEKKSPVDIRLLDLHAESSSDGKLLKVGLVLTPFTQRPSLDLTLTDSNGVLIVSTSVVEPVSWKLELNLHLRNPTANLGEEYNLTAVISYPDIGEVDRQKIIVKIPLSSI